MDEPIINTLTMQEIKQQIKYTPGEIAGLVDHLFSGQTLGPELYREIEDLLLNAEYEDEVSVMMKNHWDRIGRMINNRQSNATI